MTTIVSIFAIIAAISTVIYTVITVKTLKEIRRQRETTYLPNVILGESSYTMLIDDKLKHNSILFEDIKSKIKSKHCFLNIYNIGLASAKNLKFTFNINDQEYIKLASKNIDGLEISEMGNGFLSIEHKELKSGHNLSAQKYREKDFLIPINIENKSFQLELPNYLMSILFLLVYNLEDNYELLEELPYFELKIEYEDLSNKTHWINYQIKFNIFSMTKTDVIFEILKERTTANNV
ncbi:hypothetical protein QRD02_14295 [Aequorivita sp. SDUM287046]|uniref:Uncharacterized protein n=1 Tax=Aequorivita aurantiaca TaxID=3053356 RepID=A0ABT8DJJ6_9FLAO|nr:hypothetical protein [Aequorivita aurantiaca]MDN3725552.1 hypothetical protein [Aequorivita aurantiaca]